MICLEISITLDWPDAPQWALVDLYINGVRSPFMTTADGGNSHPWDLSTLTQVGWNPETGQVTVMPWVWDADTFYAIQVRGRDEMQIYTPSVLSNAVYINEHLRDQPATPSPTPTPPVTPPTTPNLPNDWDVDAGAITVLDPADIAGNQTAFDSAVTAALLVAGLDPTNLTANQQNFVDRSQAIFATLNTPAPILPVPAPAVTAVSPQVLANTVLAAFTDANDVIIRDIVATDAQVTFVADILVSYNPSTVLTRRMSIGRTGGGSSSGGGGSTAVTAPRATGFNRPSITNGVSLSFDLNGGTIRGNRNTAIIVQSGLSVQQQFGTGIVAQMPNPQREGYRFRGWYVGERRLTLNTPVTGPTTAVARWSAIN